MNLFLEVNNYCELKCRFCVADNEFAYEAKNMPIKLVKELIENNKCEKKKCAFITGGEPLLHPQIFEILRLLRKDDYYIYITTNGLQIQNPEFAVTLLSIGINRLAIPIYGSTESLHDTMTGIKGSFRQLIAALDNLFYIRDKYELKTKIEIRLLMSKFTNEDNVNIVDLVANKYPSVDFINLNGLQLSSRTTNYEYMIETSLTESKEALIETLERISEHNVSGTVTGIPICILGEDFKKFYEFKEDSLKLFPHISVGPFMSKIDDSQYRSKTSKQKNDECLKCKYFTVCDGLQQRYVKKYGFNDIHPIVDGGEN